MEIRIGSGKKNKSNMTLSGAMESLAVWWEKFHNFVFLLFMLASMGIGIYFWYVSIHSPIMSEQEKSDYKLLKDRSVKFLGDDFNSVVSSIEKKAENYSKEQMEIKNIFE